MSGLDNLLLNREPVEGITFGSFSSVDENLHLLDRPASSFSEKEKKEDLAYVQGDIDFSFITGERTLNNRRLPYVFYLKNRHYRDRKVLKMHLENILFRQGQNELEDTATPFHYFKGKCSHIEVEDDHKFNRLMVIIEFDCYPYMISKLKEGHNEWSNHLIPLDVVQQTEFTVNNEEKILLINSGSVSVSPKIIANNNFNVQNDEISLSVTAGENENEEFRLWPGENRLTVTGNGTITFEFYRELI